MENKREWMAARLVERFEPDYLDVVDESSQHAGHAGARPEGQTHFRIKMTSAKLAGLSRVEQHRQVNDAVKEAFDHGLHALALELKSA